jgi:hypothetical protein
MEPKPTTSLQPMRSRLIVSLATGALLAVWFGVIIAARDGNPSTLIAAGRQDTRVVAYVAGDLGPAFLPQEGWGHDGKFVFIQAHDPLLLDPSVHAAALDVPVYRSQRMLVPALVGLGALAGPWGVVWAFPALMVLAVGVGAWATAGLAALYGRSPWWGLAFVANPGLFYSYRRGTVDVVAVALLMLGMYWVARERMTPAAVALTGAVLAKEIILVAVIAVAFHRLRRGRHLPPAWGLPLLAVTVWGIYVRVRLGAPLWEVGAEVATVPLLGLAQAVARFPGPGPVVALVITGAVGLAGWQVVRRPSPEAAAAAGFGAALLLLPATVWGGYVDAWRAAAPLLALQLPLLARSLPGTWSMRLVRPGRETEVTAA